MNGFLVWEYVTKYAAKNNKPQLSEGDAFLVAMENLNPDNVVTTGTFTRLSNVYCQKGPESIFQAEHAIQELPLVFKNFEVSSASVTGISVIRKEIHDVDNDESENVGGGIFTSNANGKI